MWRRVNRDKPERDISYYIKIGLLALIGVILFSIIGNQSVIILMNIEEFGELYTKPLYYSFISGLILAAIALVRVDIRSRRSLVWWITLFIISYIRGSNEIIRYQDFKLSKINFIVWQATKVFLLAPLFTNVMFGLT